MATHSTPAAAASAPEPARRNLLVSFLALAVGAVISLFPFAAGMFVFLDPVIKKRSAAKGAQEEAGFRRICSLDAVPADGSPVKVALVADRVDAWTVDPNQPIGAVYLRRVNAGKPGKSGAKGFKVQAFNAICPHAGCFVAWLPDHKVYLCPCHNSAFMPDGEKTKFQGKTNPSPRPLDELPVELRNSGEVWVQFQNFYPGLHEKQPKA